MEKNNKQNKKASVNPIFLDEMNLALPSIKDAVYWV